MYILMDGFSNVKRSTISTPSNIILALLFISERIVIFPTFLPTILYVLFVRNDTTEVILNVPVNTLELNTDGYVAINQNATNVWFNRNFRFYWVYRSRLWFN